MLLPLLIQLNMFVSDRHDGGPRTEPHYKKKPDRDVPVRETLSRLIDEHLQETVAEPEPEPVLITALPMEGASGVLGGDFVNLEIAALMERARVFNENEDEAVTLLMLH